MNVTLRDLRDGDAAWLDTWLGVCAASVGYDAIDGDEPARSLFARADEDRVVVRIIVAGETDVGVAVARIEESRATFEFVGTPSEHARRGWGHAGASLLEVELRAAGAATSYAPAPAVHGIAMYFWIRLGYRPLLQNEWPCRRDGLAWLARDLG